MSEQKINWIAISVLEFFGHVDPEESKIQELESLLKQQFALCSNFLKDQ